MTILHRWKFIWVKNFSDRGLNQQEKEVLAKGLNFSVSLECIPGVDLIKVTDSTMRNNNLADTGAKQARLKVSAIFASTKVSPSNLTIQERKALASLQRARDTSPSCQLIKEDAQWC